MLPLLLDNDPHIYLLTHQSSRKVAQVVAFRRLGSLLAESRPRRLRQMSDGFSATRRRGGFLDVAPCRHALSRCGHTVVYPGIRPRRSELRPFGDARSPPGPSSHVRDALNAKSLC
jgi:hypothetical protein